MLSIEDKKVEAEVIRGIITDNPYLYIVDIADLDAFSSHTLRALCFERGVTIRVVKNRLFSKAIDSIEGEYDTLVASLREVRAVLKKNTAIMVSPQAATVAKLIKEFRKNHDKPIIKAACLDGDLYFGDESLDELVSIKSKEDLVADIMVLVNTPMDNVIGAVSSPGASLVGALKVISERE